ncbi:MAG: hypothetical protein ACP5IB_06950 [Thermoplasmata archaeon]
MQSYILPATLGSAIGPVQTFMLREYVDTPQANDFLSGKTTTKPLLVKQLKGFGTASALAGIIGGIVGLGLGLYSAKTGKILRTFNEQIAALTYGASALTSGIMSGIYPTTAMQNLIARDPDNPIYAATSSNRGTITIAPASRQAAIAPTSNQAVLQNFQ